MCMYIYVYVGACIYIYIHGEREVLIIEKGIVKKIVSLITF